MHADQAEQLQAVDSLLQICQAGAHGSGDGGGSIIGYGRKPIACSEPGSVVDYTQAMTASGIDDIGFSEGDIRDMKLWKASRDIENLLKKITL